MIDEYTQHAYLPDWWVGTKTNNDGSSVNG